MAEKSRAGAKASVGLTTVDTGKGSSAWRGLGDAGAWEEKDGARGRWEKAGIDGVSGDAETGSGKAGGLKGYAASSKEFKMSFAPSAVGGTRVSLFRPSMRDGNDIDDVEEAMELLL